MNPSLVTVLPNCQMCPGPTHLARYDGKTKHGFWAYMCETAFTTHGVGLGVGKGQRFVTRDE